MRFVSSLQVKWVLLGLVGATVVGCAGKYIRDTQDFRVEATPERLARGEYIVNHLAGCGACHTTRPSGSLLDGESTEMYLGGGNVYEEDGLRVWVPNITPDTETGIGTWTDDEIIRAIRDGISRDGRLMIPLMPFNSYQHMSDEDVQAVVAYLRSVPAVKQPKPREENDLPFLMGMVLGMGVAHHEPVKSVPVPDLSTPVKRGEYVAWVGHCSECHSFSGKGPRDLDDEWMAGSDVPLPDRYGKIWARNLTPDPETGLGKYSDAQVAEAMRTGVRLDGKRMGPPMSLMIPHFSGLEEADMSALIAYLRSLPPVKKAITERELTAAGKAALEGPAPTPAAPATPAPGSAAATP